MPQRKNRVLKMQEKFSYEEVRPKFPIRNTVHLL